MTSTNLNKRTELPGIREEQGCCSGFHNSVRGEFADGVRATDMRGGEEGCTGEAPSAPCSVKEEGLTAAEHDPATSTPSSLFCPENQGFQFFRVGGNERQASDNTEILLQGGAASKDRSARMAHNHEVVGSNPTPATSFAGDSVPNARAANSEIRVGTVQCPRLDFVSEIVSADKADCRTGVLSTSVIKFTERQQSLSSDNSPKFFLQRICASCKTFLGLKPCDERNHGSITHSICEPCKAAVIAQMDLGVPA